MAIPNIQMIMLPFLKLLSDGNEYSVRAITQKLAGLFDLSTEEFQETLRSGKPIFYNRIGWAQTYLFKAGLIEKPKRAYVRITNKGKDVLRKRPEDIRLKYLRKWPEVAPFFGRNKTKSQ
jgi:restriction system protein